MKSFPAIFCLIVLIMFFIGCTSTESVPVTEVSRTATSASTNATAIPISITSTQKVNANLTPGENIGILFLSDEGLQIFKLYDWSREKLPIQSVGSIAEAMLSPNGKWLVFQDKSGLKIIETPFTGIPTNIVSNLKPMDFLFSNDGESLSYSDDEGLKIYNINDGKSSMLLPHVYDEVDVWKMRSYYPIQWSPDSQWLWIGAVHWEGRSHILAHIPTKKTTEFSACYSSTDWVTKSDAFVATVNYSGYNVCGENDGVFILSLSGNSIASEKKIYSQTQPEEKESRLATSIKALNNINGVGFLQLTYPETSFQTSYLVLTDLGGNKISEFDLGENDIYEVVWSTEGNKIFYNKHRSNIIFAFDISTGEKAEFIMPSGNVYSISPIEYSGWLVVATQEKGKDGWKGFYLLNDIDGTIVQIIDLSNHKNIRQPFVGIETFP